MVEVLLSFIFQFTFWGKDVYWLNWHDSPSDLIIMMIIKVITNDNTNGEGDSVNGNDTNNKNEIHESIKVR